MAKLINAATFAKIRTVINNVQDTFYGETCIYHKDTSTITRWQKDVQAVRTYTDSTLNCLCVWDDSPKYGEDKKVKDKGEVDINAGYLLIKYDDFLAADLIDDAKQFAIATPADNITFDGVTYPIEGINMKGQLNDTNCVIKIHIRKDFKRA
jgi:hypothetical protein